MDGFIVVNLTMLRWQRCSAMSVAVSPNGYRHHKHLEIADG